MDPELNGHWVPSLSMIGNTSYRIAGLLYRMVFTPDLFSGSLYYQLVGDIYLDRFSAESC